MYMCICVCICVYYVYVYIYIYMITRMLVVLCPSNGWRDWSTERLNNTSKVTQLLNGLSWDINPSNQAWKTLSTPLLFPHLAALLLTMIQDNIVWVETFLWQDSDKIKTQADTCIQCNKSVLYSYLFGPELLRNCQGHSRRHIHLSFGMLKFTQGWDSGSSKYLLSTN